MTSSILKTESEAYKKNADALIAESGILDILKKYGTPVFVGSYAANLMMNGDIDIHVLREQPFNKEDTLMVLNDLFRHTQFNSYYLGDWNGGAIHPEFPEGYYLGLKKRFVGEKWKIDVWLVSTGEQEKLDRGCFNIATATITPEQREEILRLKKERKENNLKISGQEIYQRVLRIGLLDNS